MNVRNWLVFGAKQLTLVKESNYSAKFKSLSLRQKELHPRCGSFLMREDLNRIYMGYAGGISLPPVQTLVASIIFALGENANQVLSPVPKKNEAMIQSIAWFLFVVVYWTICMI